MMAEIDAAISGMISEPISDWTARSTGSPPRVSFEFFPPRSGQATENLIDVAMRLARYTPEFMSITYGAGGAAQERTRVVASALRARIATPIAAHLTCVGATRREIDAVAEAFWQDGICSIVALRGDVPDGGAYIPHDEGYRDAAELVAGLRQAHDFEISVAAYPEPHPDSRGEKEDLAYLRRKWEAGATRALTQFFFEPEPFLRLRDRIAAAGIGIDLVPGILPVGTMAQTRKFAAQCGTPLPPWLERRFIGLDKDPVTTGMVSTALAASLCFELRREGVPNFHFYTTNRAEPSIALCALLGRVPVAVEEAHA
ncbi:methylenetetrahydrofolate reductase [Asaia spathodeae]|uniref:methylenetetrahydrofolate reductase n=2 Tax=Asaia TaxID=91914 RepID=UPI0038D22E58